MSDSEERDVSAKYFAMALSELGNCLATLGSLMNAHWRIPQEQSNIRGNLAAGFERVACYLRNESFEAKYPITEGNIGQHKSSGKYVGTGGGGGYASTPTAGTGGGGGYASTSIIGNCPVEFAVIGEWKDPEWEELARVRGQLAAKGEHLDGQAQARFLMGPRSHPYIAIPTAYVHIEPERRVVNANKSEFHVEPAKRLVFKSKQDCDVYLEWQAKTGS